MARRVTCPSNLGPLLGRLLRRRQGWEVPAGAVGRKGRPGLWATRSGHGVSDELWQGWLMTVVDSWFMMMKNDLWLTNGWLAVVDPWLMMMKG